MFLPSFCDAHLHLQDSRFTGERAGVIARAIRAGVNRMLCNGVCEEDWQVVLMLASQYPEVTPFLGVHPWYADAVVSGWEERLAVLLQENSCGIGEAGLDKNCGVDKQQQTEVFMRQLNLAVSFSRPLVVHCVRCWGQLLDLLAGQAASRKLPLIMMHSFGGSLEVMRRLISLGCYLSFSAKILHQPDSRVSRVFMATPLERVLLETDAPDQLYPTRAERRVRNEPVFITGLYSKAAQMRAIDFETFCTAVWNNAKVFTGAASAR